MSDEALPSRYRPLTERERALALALGRCRFLPGSADKRFALDMAARADRASASITEKQAAYLVSMAWRYRRQLPPDIRPAVAPAPSSNRRPNELAGSL